MQTRQSQSLPVPALRWPSPVEPLHLMGAAQELAPLLGQLLQGPPTLIQLLQEDSRASGPRQTLGEGPKRWCFNLKGKAGTQVISSFQPSYLNTSVHNYSEIPESQNLAEASRIRWREHSQHLPWNHL